MNVVAQMMTPLHTLLAWPVAGTTVAAVPAVAEDGQSAAESRRRRAYFAELVREFATVQPVALQHYRAFGSGEIHPSNTPAVEYFRSTAEVRLCHLLGPEVPQDATLVQALGMRRDVSAGEADVIDVKPVDRAPIERDAITLGPVPAFQQAQGTCWRFFIELTYSTAEPPRAGGIPGGIAVRRIVVDCTL
jgi:hypothetical protein